eukprot:c3569_g1_i1.p3 GENE.c3569_g1_i1~~c3569_g1_i1.p3  ORF type:complete len:154 (+),score=27.47 c3569_g1_i1:611-1072(+)
MRRLGDAVLSAVLGAVLSVLLCVPLVDALVTRNDARTRRIGAILGWSLAGVFALADFFVFWALPHVASLKIPFRPRVVLSVFATSMLLAWCITEPTLTVAKYYLLGLRALHVTQGGTGGVPRGADVAPEIDKAVEMVERSDQPELRHDGLNDE